MDSIFTLPYPEYSVADKLKDLLPECSVFVTLSRYERFDVDLIVYRRGTRNMVRIKVGAYGTYDDRNRSDTYATWLNNFAIGRYNLNHHEGAVDFYIFFAMYPDLPDLPAGKVSPKDDCASCKRMDVAWKKVYLCLTDKEMQRLLKQARKKKEDDIRDRFFGFCFSPAQRQGQVRKVRLGRGFSHLSDKDREASQYLLERRTADIRALLEGKTEPISVVRLAKPADNGELEAR